MRIVICPDKFAGTLSAQAAAEAIAAGWRLGAGTDQVEIRPLADGGPGFVDVLANALGPRAERTSVVVTDPLGRPATAELLLRIKVYPQDGDPRGKRRPTEGPRTADDLITGYLESAQACGLHLLLPHERDPRRASSAGLGPLVRAALEGGAERIVLGLGGSATNDCGAGLLAALGIRPLDAAGRPLPPGGAPLRDCARLALPATLTGGARPTGSGRGVAAAGFASFTEWAALTRPAGPAALDLVAAVDVDNPLTGPAGASAVFGPQKGAQPAGIAELDAALGHFAAVLERDLPGCPPRLATLPGGGAAGGLGAAVLALGGRCASGIDLVRAVTGVDQAIAGADLVITGEGSFDRQSLRGKVVAGVAATARSHRVPCLVLAGRAEVDPAACAAAGVHGVYTLVEYLGGVEPAMRHPAEGLTALAAELARSWPARAGRAARPERT